MKSPVLKTRLMSRICAFSIVALLTACGSNDDSSKETPAAQTPPTTQQDGQTPSPAVQQRTAASTTVEYASVASVPLSSVGLPDTVTGSQVSVLSGAAAALTVTGGEIRFITPSDPGTDAEVKLKVSLPDAEVTVPIAVRSARPTEAVTLIEPDENGQVPENTKNAVLKITGLGAGNILTGGALSFSVAGAPALDAKASGATVFIPQTGVTIGLAKDWVLNPADNTLTVPADKVSALIAALPAGEVEFDIGLTSEDGEFAVGWTFLAHKATATLNGKVVDLSNALQPSAAGKLIGIRGLDNRTRIVSVVDATGAFKVSPVGSGTYEMSILDTAAPGFWTSTVPIFPGSTTVNANLVYAPTASGGTTQSSVTALKAVTSKSTTVQDGKGPAPRVVVEQLAVDDKAASPASCETVRAPGESTYKASAAAQNSTISCVATHTVPAGSTKVSLTVSIFSAEYPSYTTQKSQFNDSWAYAVSGLPGVGGASGSVNDTHYSQGTITKKFCVDVTQAAKSAPLVFNANLSATNIGDSALTTTVTMDVALTCNQALRVTKATFTSPNKNGNPVISPIVGNLAGHYVSVPINTAVQDWGLPLSLEFEPKEAVITSAKVGVVVGGAEKMSDVDVFGQITSNQPGKLSFADLVIPRMPVTVFGGKTNVVIQLTGTLNGQSVKTEPLDGQIKFGNDATYVPLFLAGDVLPAARRYGVHTEPGKDSWATANAITWLQSKAYRFDDISGLHIAQIPAGDSILQHKGHNDGTQIDMRYSDGSGGYTDPLGGAVGGATIKKMLDDAAKEAAAEAAAAAAAGNTPRTPLPMPNLVKANAWITANRAMLAGEASGARKLHAGPSWMKLALYDAKFPNKTPIPQISANGTLTASLGAWTSKPENLTFIAPHLHHWHISRSGI
jgi:hypothetical protein